MENKGLKRHLTEKAPKAIGPYSTAVIHGNTAFLSGMIPIDPATGKLVEGGIEAQTKRVMENIALVLDELGLCFDDIIKTTIFLTDLDNFAKVNAVYGQALNSFPARSCVQVSRLPLAAEIEIEVIAAIN